MPDSSYVAVYTTYGTLNADMVRLFLEAQGISAVVQQESAGVTYGLTVGPLGEAVVLVPAEQEVEARHLLEQMDSGEIPPVKPEDAGYLPTDSDEDSTGGEDIDTSATE